MTLRSASLLGRLFIGQQNTLDGSVTQAYSPLRMGSKEETPMTIPSDLATFYFRVRCLDTSDDCYLAKHPEQHTNMRDALLLKKAHAFLFAHRVEIDEVRS